MPSLLFFLLTISIAIPVLITFTQDVLLRELRVQVAASDDKLRSMEEQLNKKTQQLTLSATL